MKKQLLLNFTKFLSQKMTLRMAAFAVVALLTVQTSFAQTWPILGNETAVSSVAASFTNVAVLPDSNGTTFTPYVAYIENLYAGLSSSGYPATGIAKVKKRQTDGTWVQVGADITATGASFTRIYADASGNLYITYVDGAVSSKLAVRKYNSVSGNWDPLNGDANNLYVSTASATHTLKNFFTSPRSSMAFDSQGTPYIAFCGGTPFSPIVKKYDSMLNTWVTVGSGNVSTDISLSPSLTIDNDGKPWLAYTATADFASGTTSTGQLKLYTCSDTSTSGSWSAITIPAYTSITGSSSTSGLTSAIRDVSLTCIKATVANTTTSGNLAIVTYNTSNSSKATVIMYNKTTQLWTFSSSVSSNAGATPNLISDNSGNLYCSFVDQNSSSLYFATSKVRKLAAGQTTLWTELKDNPGDIRGLNDQTGSLHLAVASTSTIPYIVYTKANLTANISTPIVRKYDAPVGTAPVINGFTPAFTTTTPTVSTVYTITGSNFTGATAVTLGGNTISTFTVTNDTSITWTVIPTTQTNLSVSVTTPNGTTTITGTPPSALSYASVPSTYNGAPLYSTVTASSNLIYSVGTTLPTGLSINTGNGTISGVSTAVFSSASYVITAANNFGSTTSTITFAAGAAPTISTYGTVSSGYAVGSLITPLTPTLTGTATTATYSVSPSLPAGLAFDTTTGIISGTPTSVTASTVYTVTATTTYGFTTKTITFATGIVPSGLSYTASASYPQNTAITSLVASITPGTGTPVYTVTALPVGLAISSSTGVISGTPTTVTASAPYTVTATTIYGTTTNVITFSVDASLASESFAKEDTVKVYPNPTTDTVTVSVPNNVAIEKIAVYNSLGQLMSVETKNTVSLQNLASGNYYLTIYTAEGNYAKKIIKQ